MNKPKFTPSPWTVGKISERLSNGNYEYRVTVGDWRVNYNQNTFPADSAETNVHLIAAAPDLYEILEKVLNEYAYYRYVVNSNCKFHMQTLAPMEAELVLAKARGEV